MTDLETIERRLESFAASITERFDRLEASTDKRFDRLEANTDKRFDRLEASTDERFDRLEAHAVKADERFDRLEAHAVKADERLANIEDNMATKIELARTRASLEEGQDLLLRVIRGHTDQLGAVQPALSELDRRVSTLESIVGEDR